MMMNSASRLLVTVLAAFVLVPVSAAAQDQAGDHAAHSASADSAAVAAVVEEFHSALQRGDSAQALELLAAGARILEGGGVETVQEYASHHLPADMAFAAAVTRERGPLHIQVRGDVAWATSTSRVQGTYGEREIDSRGAELVVLARSDGRWRIEAIHWSSR